MTDSVSTAKAISRRLFIGLGAAVPFALAASDAVNSKAASNIDLGRFYRLRSALSTEENPLCIDVTNCIFKNTTNIQIYNGLNYQGHNAAQCFHFKKFSDGSYGIRSMANTLETESSIPREFMSLDVAGGNFNSGTNVQLYTYNGNASQRWFPVKNSDGTWTFYSAGNRQLCLDVAGGAAADCTNVQIYTSNGTPSQRFFLEEFPDQPEPFSDKTSSTHFSALETDIELENGSPEITYNDRTMDLNKRTIGLWSDKGHEGAKWEKYRTRWYRILDSSAELTAVYPKIGTYYGRTIGARSKFSNFVKGPYNSSAMVLLVPEYFSQEDPGAMWVTGVKSVRQTVEFFYSDDATRSAIDIDQCYWSVDSLTNQQGVNFEYALPLSPGFTGDAYVLSDYLERIGHPTIAKVYFGGDGAEGLGYVAISSTRTDPANMWANSYCGVTFSYSGRSLSLELGNNRKKGVDSYYDNSVTFGGCLSSAFKSLYKSEDTPVHFVVYDEFAAAEDPAYSPKEVFQVALQKGTKIDPGCDVVKDATRALLDAYPGSRKGDDYWFESKDFDSALGTITVKSDPIFIWARVSCGTVEYYVDGIDDTHIVMTDANVVAGPYGIPDKADKAAQAAACNLNEHFGEDNGSGLLAWFTDPELTDPARDLKVVAGRTLKLYARNRLTLRCDFTDDSVDTTTLVLRTSPESAAPLAESWTLPDFGLSDERHTLDGIALPAIGDDGPAHKALYLGESVTLARPTGRVYARMEDGTWAGFRAVAWLASQDSDSQITKVTPTRDTCVYMRVERADYDGVSSTKN